MKKKEISQNNELFGMKCHVFTMILPNKSMGFCFRHLYNQKYHSLHKMEPCTLTEENKAYDTKKI